MIKFFRKIRQQLLTENKFNRYLLYALGEIVLVVFGILIALTINKNYEQRQTEKKIALIFEEILDEIEDDIFKINGSTRFYQWQDSLTYLVINGRLTEENYLKNTPEYLFDLTYYSSQVPLTNNAYTNLLPLMNEVPVKYEEIIKELELLYHTTKKRVEFLNNQTFELSFENLKNQYYNYPWATLQIPNNQNEGYIEYLVHDNNYRGIILFQHTISIKHHLRSALLYKYRAISVYRKIAKLHNKTIDNAIFAYEPDIANLLVGTWKSKNGLKDNFELYIGPHELLSRKDKNSYSDINYFVGKNKIITLKNIASFPTFYTIVKDKDEIFMTENDGTIWSKIKK
ncbi:MAG: hypothetical protein HKN89_05925 [Eudoraea sp.]|nr:hypothetical protein [Eudoraea sp.]